MLPSLLIALALQQPKQQPKQQPAAPDSALRVTPTVTAARAARAPEVDGRLDEAAWRLAVPVTAFWQSNPRQGEPASERTEVRVLYDDAAIYVGARLHERDPRRQRAVLTRRDGYSPSDLFTVALDSYHDHQTAMVFSVNPLGVRSERLASNDQSWGDDSWDPVWQAATHADSLGWTAELRIPLSQLRFPPRAQQLWGVNFFRTLTTRNESDAFVLVRQSENGFASRFAHLAGIAGVPSPKRVELLPYARSQVETRRATPGDPFFTGREAGQALGLDAKYGVTSNLTLDATVNPDFGQVEADPAQLNLTVFEQFFQERRPFFVEGAQIFDFGSAGGYTLAPGDVFYPRRVGRAPSLSPSLARAYGSGGATAADSLVGPFTSAPKNTPILAAAKLSGRLARGTSVGLLHAETGRVMGAVQAERIFGHTEPADSGGEPAFVVDRRERLRYADELEPRSHYTVGRLKQDFRGGQSFAGLLVTQVLRDTDGGSRLDSLVRRDARTVGLDWQHRWAKNRFNFTGNAVYSAITGSPTAIAAAQRSSARYYQRPDQSYLRYDPTRTALRGSSASAKLRYDGPSGFGAGVIGNATTPGYELNDVGFLTRADSRTVLVNASYGTPKPGKQFQRLAVEPGFQSSWNNGGERTGQSAHANFQAQLQNNWGAFASVRAGARGTSAVPTRGGPAIMSTPNRSANLNVWSDSRRALSGSGYVHRFLSESGTNNTGGGLFATWRPRLNTELSVGPNYNTGAEMGYLVARVADTLATATYGARYVFGRLEQTTLSLATRANLTFTPALSFQLYAEPFASGASASGFRELRRPGVFEFDYYGRDPGALVARDSATGDYAVTLARNGEVVKRFTIPNPDARFRSLRGSAVLRWEYRPGATLFAVWTHNRGEYEAGGRYGGAGDLTSLLGLPPENVFLLKVNYWLSR